MELPASRFERIARRPRDFGARGARAGRAGTVDRPPGRRMGGTDSGAGRSGAPSFGVSRTGCLTSGRKPNLRDQSLSGVEVRLAA
ncbi:hypothetical protein Psuf_084530 [Phytohabitans suffuscus]|uniref:Uncharacterized protein n=1 Tax=Phytohabitans suffuscus TaxID=624315 RepID=A0A6F8YY85_9ACTN|nr:hypothetical protein Psuf_084530 [Phytohabitans suffuscus]